MEWIPLRCLFKNSFMATKVQGFLPSSNFLSSLLDNYCIMQSEVFLMDRSVRHAPDLQRFMQKGVIAHGAFWISCRASMKICCYFVFMKSPPSLLNYVYVVAFITMATPLHHHLKFNGATSRTRRPLFLVISPVM